MSSNPDVANSQQEEDDLAKGNSMCITAKGKSVCIIANGNSIRSTAKGKSIRVNQCVQLPKVNQYVQVKDIQCELCFPSNWNVILSLLLI